MAEPLKSVLDGENGATDHVSEKLIRHRSAADVLRRSLMMLHLRNRMKLS